MNKHSVTSQSVNIQDSLFNKLHTHKDSTFNTNAIDTNVLIAHKKTTRITQLKPIEVLPKINQAIATKSYFIDDNSLINKYLNTIWLENKEEKLYSVSNKQLPNPSPKAIFGISKDEVANKTILQIFPKERNSINLDWYIFPILAGLIVLVFVYNAYSKYFGQLYESIFFRFVSKKLVNDKNVAFRRFSYLLDLLFILSFSLVVDQVFNKFNLYSSSKGTEFILAIFVALFLITIKIIRFIVFRISILFTKQKTFLNDLYLNTLLYTRILGLILLPFAFLMIYFPTQLSLIIIYLTLIIIFICLIFRTIRSLKVFMDNGFSIFYFILYLCALEIAPILVIWKEVQAR